MKSKKLKIKFTRCVREKNEDKTELADDVTDCN